MYLIHETIFVLTFGIGMGGYPDPVSGYPVYLPDIRYLFFKPQDPDFRDTAAINKYTEVLRPMQH